MEFKPVKQNRIANEIVSQLKRAILSGHFKPGQRMPTERELTAQFKVSRVVVREAVRELEIKGLVKILQGPAGGAYVTDLSFDHLNNAFLDLFQYNKISVAELIATRILIECEVVRLAAVNVGADWEQRLQTALAEEAAENVALPELIVNRLLVHYLLAEMSNNRVLQAIVSSLYRLTAEVILEVKPVKEIIHRREEHAQLIEAVLSRDPEAAAQAMKRHLQSLGKKLVKLEGLYRSRKGLFLNLSMDTQDGKKSIE